MSSVQQHAQNIVALAKQADSLVDQFRALLANLNEEEAALHLAAQKRDEPHVADSIAGRRRLGLYALALASIPADAPLSSNNSKTVTELATAAWSEFLR